MRQQEPSATGVSYTKSPPCCYAKRLQMPDLNSSALCTSGSTNTVGPLPCLYAGRPQNINTLPWEILSFIFTHSVQAHDNPMARMLSPLVLSHVCSLWRHVSTSTAELWATLALGSSILTTASLSRSMTFLRRSKSRPVELFLDFRDPCWAWEEEINGFASEEMKNILDILLPEVYRWKSVTLLTDTWAPIHTFLTLTSSVTSAPMLTDVSLLRCNEYLVSKGQAFLPANLKEPVPLFGGRLTRLRNVTLSGVHVEWASSCLRNLETLELKYHAHEVSPHLHEFLRILGECPTLKSLSLVGWGTRLDMGHGAPSSGVPVSLPCLKKLEIGFVDIDHTVKVLTFLHFPKLEDLFLQDVAASLGSPNPVCCDSLLDYLANRRVLREVRGIQLHHIHASYASLAKFFSSTPHLSSLTLHKSCGDVLEVLKTRQTETGLICPRLKDLHCRNMLVHPVLECILDRMRLTSELESVVVDISGSESVSVPLIVYEAFAAMGTELRVVVEEVEEERGSRRGSFASVLSDGVE
ncbi:hypothetical protein OE88DRAFT_802018 [Heliocybe sulcata]|uniref:Uncharacterized protein n=1 Tax=Heliocybe sulcata TaxID=5364 RepID=A0A5C3MSJ8_9AGAM|nr:hypothetical protein OE88DRAFT_802018 [Heliocybe sulcata]